LTRLDYCDRMYLPLKRGFICVEKKTLLMLQNIRLAHLPSVGIYTERVKKMRVKITLACTECKQRNYDTMKNKKNDPDRLEMNKYCRFCKKHTLHKETK